MKMKSCLISIVKKGIAGVLSVVTALTVSPANVTFLQAEAVYADNSETKVYEGFTYDVAEDNTVTITGYSGSGTDIVIPAEIGGAPVTCIGESAFCDCSSLISVGMPESVTSIGDYAFYDCSSLTGISMPEGVAYIGDGAFCLCSSLTDVVIPESVTYIGCDAFYFCDSLTSIRIPEGVEEIGEYAFLDCSSLQEINVAADNGYYMSESGVLFNKAQTKLICCPAGKQGGYEIPSGVTDIEGDAFSNCSGLTGIVIPEGVTSIGDYSFFYCSSLTGISIPEGVTSIGSSAFEGCSSLTNISIPEGVTSIGNSAFYGCSSLVSVVIPESLTSIDNYAFCDCSRLTDITIPESVTYIGNGAFYGCSRLTDIGIPKGVAHIGNNVFYGCDSLQEIDVAADNGQYMSESGVLYDKAQTKLICCPAGKQDGYEMPESVTAIGSYAFYGCSSLTSIRVPESVAAIGGYAFYGCSSLQEIIVAADNGQYMSESGILFKKDQTELICCPAGKRGSYEVPESVTNIGNGAFCDCSSLTSITIPENVTKIGDNAFHGCDSLLEINVAADNGKYMSENGVLYNKAQTGLLCYPAGKQGSYEIPDKVTYMVDFAFEGCSGLTSISIPAGITNIADSAFCDCSSLQEINVAAGNEKYMSKDGILYNKAQTGLLCCPVGKQGGYDIPEGVVYLDYSAFTGCSGLTSINIPQSVRIIGADTFFDCSSLQEINVSADNEYYLSENGVLFNKAQTKLIRFPTGRQGGYEIPASVMNIEHGAFSNCGSLTDVVIPASVTYIGGDAFRDCSGLTDVEIPASVMNIGYNAFGGCSSLQVITFAGEDVPDNIRWLCDDADDSEKLVALEKIYVPDAGYDAYVEELGNSSFLQENTEILRLGGNPTASPVSPEPTETAASPVSPEPTETAESPVSPEPTETPEPEKSAEPVVEVVYGDLDDNGRITAADALTVLQIVVKLKEPTDLQTKVADVNADNIVNANDALLILKKVVKLIDSFPAELMK